MIPRIGLGEVDLAFAAPFRHVPIVAPQWDYSGGRLQVTGRHPADDGRKAVERSDGRQQTADPNGTLSGRMCRYRRQGASMITLCFRTARMKLPMMMLPTPVRTDSGWNCRPSALRCS